MSILYFMYALNVQADLPQNSTCTYIWVVEGMTDKSFSTLCFSVFSLKTFVLQWPYSTSVVEKKKKFKEEAGLLFQSIAPYVLLAGKHQRGRQRLRDCAAWWIHSLRSCVQSYLHLWLGCPCFLLHSFPMQEGLFCLHYTNAAAGKGASLWGLTVLGTWEKEPHCS